MYEDAVPEQIEPRNEIEREIAMVWCRLNSWTMPISGRRMTRDECQILRGVALRGIAQLVDQGVLQYVWMHPEPWHSDDSALQNEPKS
jgi:hypothetical protein